MFRVQTIQSLDLPELQPYRTMRRQWEQRRQGIFVAEGEKVVRRLLESDLVVVSALMPEEWALRLGPILEARSEDIPVYVASKPVLEQLTGFSMYQGLLAVARVPQPLTLPNLLTSSQSPRLLAAIEGLSNAENIGVLVRNCAAFGADALLVGETCASPFLRRAVRSSMGTIFRQPVVELDNLVESLGVLRAQGIRCVAAHPHADGLTPSQVDLKGDCCLIFGSEGNGLSPGVLGACDVSVAAPMADGVDSLNVAGAGAVFLYEACRQRGKM